jgi:hypothetical protein
MPTVWLVAFAEPLVQAAPKSAIAAARVRRPSIGLNVPGLR